MTLNKKQQIEIVEKMCLELFEIIDKNIDEKSVIEGVTILLSFFCAAFFKSFIAVFPNDMNQIRKITEYFSKELMNVLNNEENFIIKSVDINKKGIVNQQHEIIDIEEK